MIHSTQLLLLLWLGSNLNDGRNTVNKSGPCYLIEGRPQDVREDEGLEKKAADEVAVQR